MEKTSMFQEPVFRRIVVGSTGLALSLMLASMAAIRISKTDGIEFAWHWSILVVMMAAFLWNGRFWNAVWEVQEDSSPASKKKLMTYVGMLFVLGIGSFLYPIRFIEQTYWSGVFRGLITAILFLGAFGWMFYKCAKGLTEIDSIEIDRQSKIHQPPPRAR